MCNTYVVMVLHQKYLLKYLRRDSKMEGVPTKILGQATLYRSFSLSRNTKIN